jgi:hypothetical protein
MHCTPRPAAFSTDDELLGYCELHCRTPVALFHREQVARVCALAGVRLDPYWPVWASVGDATMLPLIEKARARVSNKQEKEP